MLRKNTLITLAVLAALSTGACTANAGNTSSGSSDIITTVRQSDPEEINTESDTAISSDMFTERDLKQTADLTDAQQITVQDGQTVTISSEGTYVVKGSAANACIIVDAADTDKVQIVLDGVSVTNDSQPVIYVKNADKVFVTTTDSVNELTVSGAFTDDGDTHTDAVIFSKDDLVINGTGTLKISSTANGITSRDDLKVTGGTVDITCTDDALEANDSIRIADGTVTISTKKDGLHAENDDDDSVGFIYIAGGTLNIEAGDDAIHGTTTVTVDGGTLNLSARECIEATVITINDGSLNLYASDDGINAGQKSKQYSPSVTINGGDITIKMGQGDTDAIDSNGDLTINGGTLNITAQFPFDYDGTATYNGGTLIVNGEETTSITNQFGGMEFQGQGGWNGGSEGGKPGNFPSEGNGSFPGDGMNPYEGNTFPGGGYGGNRNNGYKAPDTQEKLPADGNSYSF